MNLKSMDALYESQLTDLLSAEKQLVKALPKAAAGVTSPKLRAAIEGHLEQTKEHVTRIERIFTAMKKKPEAHVCAAMEGLIKEASETLEAKGEPAVKDAAIIANAQRIEHYEIAGYGCARTYARILGREEDAEILQTTLDEEGETDHKLTEIAEASINKRAMKV